MKKKLYMARRLHKPEEERGNHPERNGSKNQTNHHIAPAWRVGVLVVLAIVGNTVCFNSDNAIIGMQKHAIEVIKAEHKASKGASKNDREAEGVDLVALVGTIRIVRTISHHCF